MYGQVVNTLTRSRTFTCCWLPGTKKQNSRIDAFRKENNCSCRHPTRSGNSGCRCRSAPRVERRRFPSAAEWLRAPGREGAIDACSSGCEIGEEQSEPHTVGTSGLTPQGVGPHTPGVRLLTFSALTLALLHTDYLHVTSGVWHRVFCIRSSLTHPKITPRSPQHSSVLLGFVTNPTSANDSEKPIYRLDLGPRARGVGRSRAQGLPEVGPHT